MPDEPAPTILHREHFNVRRLRELANYFWRDTLRDIYVRHKLHEMAGWYEADLDPTASEPPPEGGVKPPE